MTQKPVQLSVASYFYRVGDPVERTNEILVEVGMLKMRKNSQKNCEES